MESTSLAMRRLQGTQFPPLPRGRWPTRWATVSGGHLPLGLGALCHPATIARWRLSKEGERKGEEALGTRLGSPSPTPMGLHVLPVGPRWVNGRGTCLVYLGCACLIVDHHAWVICHQSPHKSQPFSLPCLPQMTPVWRAGPHGPKTLCNACGVRYMKVRTKK